MADHPLGIGYAHAMPSQSLSPQAHFRQPRKASTILLRWTSHWEPKCTLASKHTHEPPIALATYRESYDRRVASLLRASIPWQSILRSDLDSPLQSGEEFVHALALAIERRRCRMGRVKGISKQRKRTRKVKVTDATRD